MKELPPATSAESRVSSPLLLSSMTRITPRTQQYLLLSITIRALLLSTLYFYSSAWALMPRGVLKENLPSKICVVCDRPFTWRKKWEQVWEEVTTCSKSCNRKRREKQQAANRLLSSRKNEEASSSLAADFAELPPLQPMSMEQQQPDALLALIQSTALSDDEEEALEETSTLIHDHSEDDPRTARKAAKKAAKAERRAKRQGTLDYHGQKDCDVCGKSVDLLIRCTIDVSGQWKMVCGKCWHGVSGGVVDGDAQHPHYRYGGLWKNRARRR